MQTVPSGNRTADNNGQAMHQIAMLPGIESKRQALSCFELTEQDWLFEARETARAICQKQGHVTSDDVIAAIGQPQHLNATGAIFTNGEFYRVGDTRSTRPSSHARRISVWKIRK